MSTCELEKEIRELAYQNWVKAGCPQTDESERNRFWFEAEQEIIKNQKAESKEPIFAVKSIGKKKK